MRKAKLIKTGEMSPEDIDATKRIRPVSEAGVQAVLASYEEMGVIKDFVDLRRIKNSDRPRLMAGGHRLEASRRLGILVPYKLWDCSADWAELCELDDNLAGAELTVLDKAVFLARRKAVYEKLHPETKRGHAGAKSRWDATELSSFASSMAEAMGVSERFVQYLSAAGASLNADQRRWLRDAPKPVTLADLKAISKVHDDGLRSKICIAMTSGEAVSAADAIRQLKDVPPEAAPDAQYRRLTGAFMAASPAVKRRFAEALQNDLRKLLVEIDAGDAHD